MTKIDITKIKTGITILYGDVVKIEESRMGGKKGYYISVKTNNKRIHNLVYIGDIPSNITEGKKTGFVVEPKVRVDKVFVKVPNSAAPSGKWVSPLYKIDRHRVEYLNIIHTNNSISLM